MTRVAGLMIGRQRKERIAIAMRLDRGAKSTLNFCAMSRAAQDAASILADRTWVAR